MTIRVRLENGEIKQYTTYWTSSSEEPGAKTIYHTKCGLSIEERTNAEDYTCGHIDCAIYKVRDDILTFITYLALGVCGLLVYSWYYAYNPLEVILSVDIIDKVICSIISLMCVILIFANAKEWLELLELKKHGTIHGMRADIE